MKEHYKIVFDSRNFPIQGDELSFDGNIKASVVLQCDEKVSQHLAQRSLAKAKHNGPLTQKIWEHVVEHTDDLPRTVFPEVLEFSTGCKRPDRYYIKAAWL